MDILPRLRSRHLQKLSVIDNQVEAQAIEGSATSFSAPTAFIFRRTTATASSARSQLGSGTDDADLLVATDSVETLGIDHWAANGYGRSDRPRRLPRQGVAAPTPDDWALP